jgi:hypothetical protein
LHIPPSPLKFFSRVTIIALGEMIRTIHLYNIIQFLYITSIKSYHWVLPHVFPRNKGVIRKFQTFPQILRKFPTLLTTVCNTLPTVWNIFRTHCPHYSPPSGIRKSMVSSYYHNNDRLERCE